MRVRVPPASMAFTLLLSFLVAQPSFGIDMSLPALTVMDTALHVAPARRPDDEPLYARFRRRAALQTER